MTHLVLHAVQALDHNNELKKRIKNYLNNMSRNPRQLKKILNLISLRWPLSMAYLYQLTLEKIIYWTVFEVRFPGLADTIVQSLYSPKDFFLKQRTALYNQAINDYQDECRSLQNNVNINRVVCQLDNNDMAELKQL